MHKKFPEKHTSHPVCNYNNKEMLSYNNTVPIDYN